MTSLEHAAILLTLLERLQQVTAAEATLLASLSLRRLRELQAERAALAAAYAQASTRLTTFPTGALEAPVREELGRRLRAYHDARAASRAVTRATLPILAEILDALSEQFTAAPERDAAVGGKVIPFPHPHRDL